MKFLVDMPLSPAIALWLRRQGHDAVHATEVALAFASDDVILEHARGEHRLVLTADLDYPRLLAHSQADSPGLIFVSRRQLCRAGIHRTITTSF